MSEARSMGVIAVATMAAVALVLSAGALITSASASSRAGNVAPSAASTDTDGQVITVELSEFATTPAAIEATTADRLLVTNTGAIPHDLEILGTGLQTPMLNGGESAELDLGGLEPGTYEFHCSVPGHDTAGMTGTLTVAEGGEVTTASGGAEGDVGGGHGAHGADTDWAALDAAMAETIASFPAETAGVGNQPLEPEAVLDDGTKVFRLVAEIIDWEVEPGKVVEGWAYNGQMPGPMIRVDVGDKVKVIVENHLPMGTDVHWHGVRVPNDQDGVAPLTQPLIQPGEEYTYEFVAEEKSVGMYHPHHHAQMKLPNGMFGVFQIGDLDLPAGRTVSGIEVPEDLEVAQEITVVLNDAGTIGLSLNGKSFPATAPIVAKEGEWILIHYYNEGMQIHPMHLHQLPQLVVAKDGFPLDAPQWEDTVNVAPGERYSVLVQASDPGAWADTSRRTSARWE